MFAHGRDGQLSVGGNDWSPYVKDVRATVTAGMQTLVPWGGATAVMVPAVTGLTLSVNALADADLQASSFVNFGLDVSGGGVRDVAWFPLGFTDVGLASYGFTFKGYITRVSPSGGIGGPVGWDIEIASFGPILMTAPG